VLLSSASETSALDEANRHAPRRVSQPACPPLTGVRTGRGLDTESVHTAEAAGLGVEIRAQARALAVSGELDLGTEHLLTRAGYQFLAACLAQTSPPAVPSREDADDDRTAHLDLGELRFIDAGGLGALLSLRADFAAAGLRLRVSNASAIVRRVCALCRVDNLLLPTDEHASDLPAGTPASGPRLAPAL
jgi:ABC-type transporter Mla MlaB component